MKVGSGKKIKIVILACVSIAFHFSFSTFHSVQAQYKVVHLESPYNTPGSETGALRLGDTVLAYSSMPPSIVRGKTFDYSDAIMQLYQVRLSKEGKMGRPKPCRWGFNSKRDHTGNLTVDPVTHDAYFTRGDVETLRCDIWWAPGKKRRGWEKAERLRGAVNNKHYTATQPAVGRLDDSTAILYFVSDRPGGVGGLDIWYSLVRNGIGSEPINLGPQVNSPADDITPFYDQLNGVLYFSSDREGGQGGFDIYCAVGGRNTWQPAEAVCHCLNSPQNDLYFTVSDHDPASGIPTAGYLSSNRRDSYFLSDSMCCNDLYRWDIDSSELGERNSELADAIDTLSQNSELRTPNSELQTPNSKLPELPLPLYFHNDDPDPGSRDSLTVSDYADCQLRYALMRSTYLARQRTDEERASMTRFFDSCVVGNYDRTLELLEYLQRMLAEGHRVRITVSGYASPLHTDDYNHILSQRRVGSFINMIRAWRGGALAEALADGRLHVERKAMGIDRSEFRIRSSELIQPHPNSSELRTPNSALSDPVYSLPAALARRIEITNCEIF